MSSTLQDEIASTIRAELARRNLSQQEIADAVGISAVQVSKRMRGEISWRLDELETVAGVLGLTVRDLLPTPVGT